MVAHETIRVIGTYRDAAGECYEILQEKLQIVRMKINTENLKHWN